MTARSQFLLVALALFAAWHPAHARENAGYFTNITVVAGKIGLGAYHYFIEELVEWSHELNFNTGEAFWYYRNAPDPDAEPAAGSVYFSNRVPNADRLFDVDFVTPLAGNRFLAQLWAGPSTDFLRPVGEPLPFRTGAGPGFFDTRSGAVRMISSVQPGAQAFCQVRVWDTTTGTSWGDAAIKWESNILTVTTGGGGSPPSPPANLTGLMFSPWGTPTQWGILSDPVDQIVAPGGTARFSVLVFGQVNVTYQWQKEIQANVWMPIPNATSRELILDSVSAAEAGIYRVEVRHSTRLLNSFSASLIVAEPPQLSGPRLNAGGTFSVTLRAEPGHDYVVETSSNLAQWTAWQTLSNFSGENVLTHQTASSNQRFYRVRFLR